MAFYLQGLMLGVAIEGSSERTLYPLVQPPLLEERKRRNTGTPPQNPGTPLTCADSMA